MTPSPAVSTFLLICRSLYDQIYSDFPAAYNANNYPLGANQIVKIYDPVRRQQAKDKSGFVISQPAAHFPREKLNIAIQMGSSVLRTRPVTSLL